MTKLTGKTTAMPIPEGAERVYYDGANSIGFYLNGELRFIHFPPGTWRFLFTTKAATEEDARRVVGNGQYDSYGCYNVWSPYGIIDNPYDSAAEALSGLLRSKNLDENKNYALIENINTNGK